MITTLFKGGVSPMPEAVPSEPLTPLTPLEVAERNVITTRVALDRQREVVRAAQLEEHKLIEASALATAAYARLKQGGF
jgi:hypothetical protein